MQHEVLRRHVEALIFASPRPLPLMEILAHLTLFAPDLALDSEKVSEAISTIRDKYGSEDFPFELKESGGGFQFLTKKQYHPLILQLNGDKFVKKLSSSAMETLSIIAYKQPVTKLEIEQIRGVNSDYSVQRLLEKDLIYISGRKEESIGKPLLYCTTKSFMDYLGVNSPADLPQMKEILSTETTEAVPVNGQP